MSVDLSTSLGSLHLPNPVLVAAGTFGYGVEFETLVDVRRLGGVITKTLTRQPREGNPAPRLVETPSGMLNSVGLQNVGIDLFLAEKWPRLSKIGVPVIASVAGESADDFVELAHRVAAGGVPAVELNLSCPNVPHASSPSRGGPPLARLAEGGPLRCFAQDSTEVYEVVRRVKTAVRIPVLAKLSPEVTDIAEVARAAEAAGADALSLVNTLSGVVIDIASRSPVLGRGTGGLSGPAIRPIAVRCVWEARQAVKLPILGMGGIQSGQDALEFILAGASAVAVGTAHFWNPRASLQVLEELKEYLISQKVSSVQELVGAALATARGG